MNGPKRKPSDYVAMAIPIGAGGGVALGLVLMNILDNPGFFALGIAIGVTIAITIGLALAQREGGD